MHWILIIIPSQYGSETNDATPAGQDEHHSRKNACHPKGDYRRHKDLVKRDEGQLRSVGGHPEKTEANPEEMKSTVVHEEVPKEEAAVETFGALIKRYGDQHC
jgi:hypothetical protein